jgi:hypothetical protein
VINGSPRELLQSMENNDLARIRIEANKLVNFEEFDINTYISDNLKVFYNENQQRGYKNCTCSSCKQLSYPIMIKVTRNPAEYEELHRIYLQMLQYQQ